MADKLNSLYGQICEIVRQETLYLRHYIGQVISNTDSLDIGMVQVAVPEFGWTDQDNAPWCYPRQLHAMSVPIVGEWVEVYFLSGDINKPVYIGLCNEMRKDDNTRCIPPWYKGDPKTRVILQSPSSGKGIKIDDTTKELLIDAENILLIDKSTEPFVLGTQLNTFLTSLEANMTTNYGAIATAINALSPGSYVPTPPVAPTGILSTKIKGQ